MHTSLEWLLDRRMLYERYSTGLPLSTHLMTIRLRLESYLVSTKFLSGRETSNGKIDPLLHPKEMAKTIEFTLTGCIDCGVVKALPKDDPNMEHPSFQYGSAAVKMWKDPDGKHNLIIVTTRPERVFLSCQPYSKLLTENGVAAVLNFVENIPKSSEVA